MVNILTKSQVYENTMITRLKYIILTALFLIAYQAVSSQELHTQSNMALRYYNEGKSAYNYVNYGKAEQLLKKAVEKDPGFIEAQLLLAELSRDIRNFRQAEEAYRQVMAIDSVFFIPAWFGYGRVQFVLGNYNEARSSFSYYLEKTGADESNRKKALKYIEDCDFAINAVKRPVDFDPVNMGEAINTTADEYWPAITADDKMLLFTRQQIVRRGSLQRQTMQEDFYYSYRNNGEWSTAVNAGAPLNTSYNEGAQTLEAAGSYMYFTACNREDGKGGCDIYYSARSDRGWEKGINVNAPVNTRHWESQPSLSADKSRLFFVSNRPGGYGGMDIWLSYFGDNGRWSEPINLGDSINTPGDEMSPFIHFDGKTLYFSSNGRPCMGGFDIYISRMINDSTWSTPKNLGYPINTQADEIGMIVNASGNTAYFSSKVNPEMGRDLFYFDMPGSIRPDPVSYFKGTVRDKLTGRKLESKYELINLDNSDTVMISSTNRSGDFLVCLPAGNNYGLNVSSDGYLFYSGNFMLQGEHSSLEPFEKTVYLSPIKAGQQTSLHNVFFDLDSWKLRDESIPELKKLASLLKSNPGLVIEIGGHTDSTGSEEHNLLLSGQRAKSVRNYLIENGISAERLKYKGYGENDPLFDNTTEEGKRKNRRTGVRILETGSK